MLPLKFFLFENYYFQYLLTHVFVTVDEQLKNLVIEKLK